MFWAWDRVNAVSAHKKGPDGPERCAAPNPIQTMSRRSPWKRISARSRTTRPARATVDDSSSQMTAPSHDSRPPEQPRRRRPERLEVAVRGTLLEARRRLRPLGRGVRELLGRIAPPMTGGLLRVARVGVGILAGILDLATQALRWLGSRLGPLAAGLGSLIYARVTPTATVTVVTGAAAVALGASQFVDYHGVAGRGVPHEGGGGGGGAGPPHPPA